MTIQPPAHANPAQSEAAQQGHTAAHPQDVFIPGEPQDSAVVPDAEREGKGAIHLVHLYPREMSIYGDLGNTRALAARIRRHGYSPVVHQHHPGSPFPEQAHLVVGGGGQDSGQVRVEADLEQIADRLRELASGGTPMLMICGMYQLFGNAFITVEGKRLPGLGILDVTTRGNAKRMIGPVVLSTDFGDVVGYENHSGSTTLGEGQAPFGTVRSGFGNNGTDRTEGARTANVIGSYLHGPILPANPALADALIGLAAERATGRPFEPEAQDDAFADEARGRQVRRLVKR
jgi:CobQ-like glutamine amidotransferase family enzyme